MLQRLNKKMKEISKSINKILNQRNVLTLILISAMLFSVMMMMLGMYSFMNGFHSVDIGHNMKYLNAEFNLDLVDSSITGEIFDSTQAYRLGMQQQRISIVFLLMGAFIFGVTLTDMIYLMNYETFKKIKNPK